MADWLALPEVACATGLTDRTVAWRADAPWPHPVFVSRVRAWRAAFARHPGSRFALYFDDSDDFAAALYGAWHARKQVYLPGDRQAATLGRLAAVVDGFAGDLPGALEAHGTDDDQAALSPLDPHARLVVYTSGSSGEPLAIDKQLAQLDAEVHTLEAEFGHGLRASPPLAVYSTVSHQHIYGLLFQVLWPLAAGRPFVTERLLYPEQMAASLGQRPSLLVSSPAHLKRLPPTLDWSAARAGLRAVFSSGGPLPVESATSTQDLLGQAPIEVFGSSETGGIAWRQRPRHGDRWQAFRAVDWRVDDQQLAVRSPHLADADWYTTEDRVEPSDDRGFVLLGRTDRVVKIEEKRVSLTAIESALQALPWIAEARALTLPGPGGTRVALVAVPTDKGWAQLHRVGKRAFSESLNVALQDSVERLALPRRTRFVHRLPTNAQGKHPQERLAALFRPTLPQVQWDHQSPTEARAALDVSAELAVFDGHFDGMPVLPGVAQLDWVIVFGRQCFDMPPHFVRAEVLKFHRPVLPPARLALELQWNVDAGRLGFTLTSAAGAHASGRIVFGSEA